MVIKVLSLNIYPIKGMKGTSVESARVLQRGFENDRRYMLIDEQGTFISQRSHPQLVHFRPEIINKEMVIRYEDKETSISLSATTDNTIATTIFNNFVFTTEVEPSNQSMVFFRPRSRGKIGEDGKEKCAI